MILPIKEFTIKFSIKSCDCLLILKIWCLVKAMLLYITVSVKYSLLFYFCFNKCIFHLHAFNNLPLISIHTINSFFIAINHVYLSELY